VAALGVIVIYVYAVVCFTFMHSSYTSVPATNSTLIHCFISIIGNGLVNILEQVLVWSFWSAIIMHCAYVLHMDYKICMIFTSYIPSDLFKSSTDLLSLLLVPLLCFPNLNFLSYSVYSSSTWWLQSCIHEATLGYFLHCHRDNNWVEHCAWYHCGQLLSAKEWKGEVCLQPPDIAL